jgi:predicted DNA-binding protein with PD1-like motif
MEVAQIEFQSIVTVSVPHDGDVVLELEKFAKESGVTSAVILGGVGALKKVVLRNLGTTSVPPYGKEETFEEGFEITSILGNIGFHDGRIDSHIHVSIARRTSEVIGGSLLPGSIVYRRLQVVLGLVKSLGSGGLDFCEYAKRKDA